MRKGVFLREGEPGSGFRVSLVFQAGTRSIATTPVWGFVLFAWNCVGRGMRGLGFRVGYGFGM